MGSPSLGIAQTGPPRQPLGIYYRLTIQQDSDAEISNNVAAALTNSAISGILAVFTWANLNPAPGSNEWRLLDDVFGTVEQWNSTNLNNRKTVQLGINPGFDSPPWVLSNLTSCDGLFMTNLVGSIVYTNTQNLLELIGTNSGFTNSDCGCAGFLESESKGSPKILQLPLPWNGYYKRMWKSFIESVAAKYGTNPLLVSITVDGPTASSSEMILPNETNDPTNYLKWNPLFALEFPNHPN